MANPENIFPTLAENWQHFAKVDIAPNAPPVQRHEMERAFYAGAGSGLALASFAWGSGDYIAGVEKLLAELKAWQAMWKAAHRESIT